MKRWVMIVAIVGIILIGVAAVGPIMSDVETPNYQVVESRDNIEIRQYEPLIIAEVQIDGEREEAIEDGFRLLADYIFGNNKAKQDIAMTSPVQQQEKSKIAMTAPVQQQFSGETWQISFVMPSEYSMETLPEPLNDRVAIKEIPAKQFVVITFTGTASDDNMKDHEEKLMQYVDANDLLVIGTLKYAFYNPPWTLPLLRRNEIMIEIKQ